MPISNLQRDSRLSPPVLRARLAHAEDGTLRLFAPALGLYRSAPDPGSLVGPNQAIGIIEILGVPHHLLTPPGTHGLVLAASTSKLARRPVAFDDLLLTLGPSTTHATPPTPTTSHTSTTTAQGAFVFRAPTSGRLYLRPGPGKPAFISPGAILAQGHTIALIEVMKTFSRVLYGRNSGGDGGGDDFPTTARVRAILAVDESDVAAADPILELEAITEEK